MEREQSGREEGAGGSQSLAKAGTPLATGGGGRKRSRSDVGSLSPVSGGTGDREAPAAAAPTTKTKKKRFRHESLATPGSLGGYRRVHPPPPIFTNNHPSPAVGHSRDRPHSSLSVASGAALGTPLLDAHLSPLALTPLTTRLNDRLTASSILRTAAAVGGPSAGGHHRKAKTDNIFLPDLEGTGARGGKNKSKSPQPRASPRDRPAASLARPPDLYADGEHDEHPLPQSSPPSQSPAASDDDDHGGGGGRPSVPPPPISHKPSGVGLAAFHRNISASVSEPNDSTSSSNDQQLHPQINQKQVKASSSPTASPPSSPSGGAAAAAARGGSSSSNNNNNIARPISPASPGTLSNGKGGKGKHVVSPCSQRGRSDSGVDSASTSPADKSPQLKREEEKEIPKGDKNSEDRDQKEKQGRKRDQHRPKVKEQEQQRPQTPAVQRSQATGASTSSNKPPQSPWTLLVDAIMDDEEYKHKKQSAAAAAAAAAAAISKEGGGAADHTRRSSASGAAKTSTPPPQKQQKEARQSEFKFHGLTPRPSRDNERDVTFAEMSAQVASPSASSRHGSAHGSADGGSLLNLSFSPFHGQGHGHGQGGSTGIHRMGHQQHGHHADHDDDGSVAFRSLLVATDSFLGHEGNDETAHGTPRTPGGGSSKRGKGRPRKYSSSGAAAAASSSAGGSKSAGGSVTGRGGKKKSRSASSKGQPLPPPLDAAGHHTDHFADRRRPGHGLNPAGGPSLHRTYADGTYDGQIGSSGQRHGYGIMRYVDGDKYVGSWRDDMMDGMGKIEYSDGDIFEGCFKAGNFHGPGTYQYANGDKYVGEWANDLFEGHGVYSDANGSKYEGTWRQDKMEGQGKYVDAVGNEYEGEFRSGKFDGRGTLHYADGDVYVGEFRSGKREGTGTLRDSDGSTYAGSWRNNKRDGWGTCHDAMGGRFDGEYRDNKREGRGTYRWAEGEVDITYCHDDCRVGEGASWSGDRKNAWRLQGGEVVGEVSLDEAAKIAERIGLSVPK